MAYHSFRIINYQVGTVGVHKDKDQYGREQYEYAIDPGRVRSPPELYGGDQLSNDLRVRLQRLLKVLQTAYQSIKNTDDAHTLKIFLAPEFYFRPKNNVFAYTQTEYKALKTAFIETLCRMDIGQNWLIYPGTVVWCDQRKNIAGVLVNNKNRDKVSNKTSVFFNTCLTLQKRGGVFAQEKEKIHLSPNDGIPSIQYKQRHGQKGATAAEAFVQYASHVQTPFRIVSMGGVNVGLEICYEHGVLVRLLRTYLSQLDPPEFREKLHIHLLVTAGMNIKPSSISTRINGHFVRCDGVYDKTAQCEMHQVNGYGQPHRMNGQIDAEMTPITFDNSIDLNNAHPDLCLDAPQNCKEKWPAQVIHITAPIRF